MSSEYSPRQDKLLLEPNTLWMRVREQSEYALQCGALQPIPTDYEFVEHNGIRFLIRIVSNLARKDKAKKQQKKKQATSDKEFNPFLPYEEDLFVADISDTHLALLNKYNVVDHHLLMVTREFEEQESLLNVRDFEALWVTLAEIDGLAFYNSGKMAGASQRHKHLQLVPLPLIPEAQKTGGVRIPIEPAIAATNFQNSVGTTPQLPFVHAIAKVDPAWVESPLEAAQASLECYHTLLRAVGLNCDYNSNRLSGAYNLLVTREWMLVVPRVAEEFESISVNSLGFAGVFLVRNPQQMEIIKQYKPGTILQAVAPC